MTPTDDTQKIQMPPVAADLRCPHLVVVHGESVGRVFGLLRPEIIIGRDLDAHIRLTESTVSRRHAAVRTTGPQITIEDLGSRNGTFVDMERVKEPRALKDGDHVTVVDSTLLKVTYAVSGEAAVRRAGFEHVTRDPETLVSNTFYLLDRLRGDHAYARRHGQPLTLVFFRVSRASATADASNSSIDHTLRDVARVIREAMRTDELLARASGADLVGIVRSDEGQAVDMAARVKARIGGFLETARAKAAQIALAAAVVPVSTSEALDPETIMIVAHERARQAFASGAAPDTSTSVQTTPVASPQPPGEEPT